MQSAQARTVQKLLQVVPKVDFKFAFGAVLVYEYGKSTLLVAAASASVASSSNTVTFTGDDRLTFVYVTCHFFSIFNHD